MEEEQGTRRGAKGLLEKAEGTALLLAAYVLLSWKRSRDKPAP